MNSSGTDEYISRIVSQYSQTLFRAAYTILHSHADCEDIVQEVFIKLLKLRPNFNNSEHEKAWLLRVTINMSKNQLKKRQRFSSDFVDNESTALNTDNNDIIATVLSLDEKYSTVIHLYYYEGYSIAEIGRILSLPRATVGTRLTRARSALKEKLKGDMPYE